MSPQNHLCYTAGGEHVMASLRPRITDERETRARETRAGEREKDQSRRERLEKEREAKV